MITLVELCCGTAAVSLWALGRCRPITGYMGSKRRDAEVLVQALDVASPDRVVLVDGGPWGDVWATLQHLEGRRAVAATLRAWGARGTLPEIWPTLLYPPPAGSVPARGAVPVPPSPGGGLHPGVVVARDGAMGVAVRVADRGRAPAQRLRAGEANEA